jgi:hypothetical protein
MLLRDIWYLFNLGQFDPINRTIPLSITKELNEIFVYHLKYSDVFGDEQKDVKRQPGDGEADADAGQHHHHLAVALHLALLPTRVAGKAGIFSEK